MPIDDVFHLPCVNRLRAADEKQDPQASGALQLCGVLVLFARLRAALLQSVKAAAGGHQYKPRSINADHSFGGDGPPRCPGALVRHCDSKRKEMLCRQATDAGRPSQRNLQGQTGLVQTTEIPIRLWL